MVQNMVFVADDTAEQPFVGGSAEFFKRTEIRRGKVAARTVKDGRFYALSVGRIGLASDSLPGAGCVLTVLLFGDEIRQCFKR